MTDETKKLFDAPWTVVSPDDPEEDRLIIIAAGGLVKIANDVDTLVDANRLARLPELYDALTDVLTCRCNVCMGHVYGKEIVHPEQIEDCPIEPDEHNFCPNREHWKLLQKVRDGE